MPWFATRWLALEPDRPRISPGGKFALDRPDLSECEYLITFAVQLEFLANG